MFHFLTGYYFLLSFKVCHEIASGPISQYISLGTQDTADFKYDGDTLTLSYSVTTEKNDVQ